MSDSDIITITSLGGFEPFQNDEKLIEVVIRDEKNRFKTFYKVAIKDVAQQETQEMLQEAIEKLNSATGVLKKNTKLINKSIKILNGLDMIGKLNLVLSGTNLCATCVGFTIMYEKLEDLSAQITARINKVIELKKDIEAIQTNYEFKKVLSEHSNMLDCRKKQNYYSEDKMRELVSAEYDLLDMLLAVYRKDVSNDNDLIFTILSLASMLAVSLKYFDEVYYFNNKAAIGDGDVWHLDHDKWVSIFDELGKPEMVERIQDFGLLDLGLSTIEADSLYMNYCSQIKGLKQEIKDNQTLIQAVGDPELFGVVQENIKTEVQNQIEGALQQAGLDKAAFEDAIRVAVA